MAGRGAVVDQRMAVFLLEKRRDIGHADFHLECGGYPIERLHPAAGEVLSMLVQVDKPRGYDESLGADDTLPASGSVEMRAILPLLMPTLRIAVESGFGVHDPSAFDDEIVLLR